MDEFFVHTKVGVWRQDSTTMEWDFILSERYPPKDVNIWEVRCFDDVVSCMVDSFGIDTTGKRISITYWMPNEPGVWTHPLVDQSDIRPMEITNDWDVLRFLLLLSFRIDTNLHVSVLEDPVVTAGPSSTVVVDNRGADESSN